ncbi:uncharacterized protein ATNIH1004_002081 [Aspergillus tanneri]|uniref:Uncharacterized protein n=1 Tax=Aspergillus tanneri TaxID=1220188 RepID=A0A5M9M723_9EURO|nr:uncharacterized protein ATNIH1004_002081 [Aspergillus tanneri]KAA8641280.1 hypothetical protein ATNIH1004_002081 [Aspergillus tanneri]
MPVPFLITVFDQLGELGVMLLRPSRPRLPRPATTLMDVGSRPNSLPAVVLSTDGRTSSGFCPFQGVASACFAANDFRCPGARAPQQGGVRCGLSSREDGDPGRGEILSPVMDLSHSSRVSMPASVAVVHGTVAP